MKKPLIKNGLIILAAIIFLPGCATYKFHHGKAPYNKGYVVSRDDYTILEYTIGKDNTVPKIKLAKERFKRRRKTVEDYYKRMRLIQNHFTMVTIEPTISFLKIVGGIFRLPFIAISDYRYDHNPKYREKVLRREAEQDLKQENRISALKEKLNAYIQKDLTREEPYKEVKRQPAVAKLPAKSNEAEATLAPEPKPIIIEPTPEPPKETIAKQKYKAPKAPIAVIIAKPTKGFSPLRVRFYGNRSHSPGNRIIAYAWDFGDGDTSTKKNPINTYYSGSFEPRYYTITLTVYDNKGNTASTKATIEVLNK